MTGGQETAKNDFIKPETKFKFIFNWETDVCCAASRTTRTRA